MADKKVKIVLKKGQGLPPGFVWNGLVLDMAHQDAISFLSEDQYAYVAEQFRELAREADPTHSQLVSVLAVEEFWELREKGGPLGKINVRLFFAIDKARRALVVLGVFKKEAEGQTPSWLKIRVRRRNRMYFEGAFGLPL